MERYKSKFEEEKLEEVKGWKMSHQHKVMMLTALFALRDKDTRVEYGQHEDYMDLIHIIDRSTPN